MQPGRPRLVDLRQAGVLDDDLDVDDRGVGAAAALPGSMRPTSSRASAAVSRIRFSDTVNGEQGAGGADTAHRERPRIVAGADEPFGVADSLVLVLDEPEQQACHAVVRVFRGVGRVAARP